MKATRWRARAISKPNAAAPKGCRLFASLALSILLSECSVVPPDTAVQQLPPANYGALVGASLRDFADYSTYRNFGITAPRWVHAATGWGWLACVRYYAGARLRMYSYFINNDAIVAARYDTLSDQCGVQQYLPFDPNTGAIASPAPVLEQPMAIAQPIY